MQAMDSEHPAQPQLPMEVGLDFLTLEPLRTHGLDALDTEGLSGIIKITLRLLEITYDNSTHDITIKKGDDLFNRATLEGRYYSPVPRIGRLTHAIFDINFADSPKSRVVDLRVPNLLKLARGSDAKILQPWLLRRGFAISIINSEGRSRTSDAQAVAMP